MRTRLRYVYRAYRYRFRVDPAELRFVREILGAGQVAADVGCHKGAYTYWMRRQVGPGGAVFAFEPQPQQVAYLRRTFTAMRYDNVVLVPVALSDREGQMPLSVPVGEGLTHAATLEGSRREPSGESDSVRHTRINVEVTTLDAFFSRRQQGPNLLKIDVEGHESAVLAGGRETLERHRPALLIECEARHRADGDVRPVFEQLASLGYAGSFFHEGRRRPLCEFEPTVHQRRRAKSGALPAGYVNNFAFVARL